MSESADVGLFFMCHSYEFIKKNLGGPDPQILRLQGVLRKNVQIPGYNLWHIRRNVFLIGKNVDT